MPDIYTFLKAHKGLAYTHHESYSLLAKYPNIPEGKKPKGNSRIVGDISDDDQKIVIDLIVSIAARHGLDYAHIAYALLMCKSESDFNPDAAAGSSSAGGLAQFTVATVDSAKNITKEVITRGKDHKKHKKIILVDGAAQKYLGFDLNMSGTRIFDATIGANAVVLSVLMCRAVAQKNNHSPKDDGYWQLLYGLHHDGLYNQDKIDHGGWSSDAVNTYERVIEPRLASLTKLLQDGKVDTTLHLTGSDEAPISGVDYILVAVKKTFKEAPSHASSKQDNKPDVQLIQGKTDGQGQTKPINTGIGDEIIMLLLPKNYRDLFMSSNASNMHTVTKGETLTKIAKNNDTTVIELKVTNHISNVDSIEVGQKIELPPPKQLRHKPANWVLDEIMKKIGFEGGNPDTFTYARNHTAKPKGSTSKSTDKSKANTVELSTHKPAADVTKMLNSEPEKHKTDKSNPAKTVKLASNHFNKEKFSKALTEKSLSSSVGKCAKYVRIALEAGGGNTKGHPVAARLYGPTLKKIGFKEISTADYDPQLGDIVIFDKHQDGNKSHPYGHIAGYNGAQWISDFKQKRMNPYKGSPDVPYKIYRYPN
ncbi:MAG: LysM peptidoglycan-binding domain-containing protein [Legionellales bacterium]